MKQDPLLSTLLDLDAELGHEIGLIVGGGYGLYLKQLHLDESGDVQTLFPLDELPAARATQDIDIILRAEVATDSASMRPIRAALDRMGFAVVERAKYMQFLRPVEVGSVKIDLLVGPLGEFAGRVPNDPRRVKPQPSVKLHARRLDEAVAVEEQPLRIPLFGMRSSGQEHRTTVLIPQAFTYLVMKLLAFKDQLDDADKELGRHHALDIYRIVGLLTKDEDATARDLVRRFDDHPAVGAARDVAARHFIEPRGMGRIRIREHQLATPVMDLDRFAQELRILLFGDS